MDNRFYSERVKGFNGNLYGPGQSNKSSSGQSIQTNQSNQTNQGQFNETNINDEIFARRNSYKKETKDEKNLDDQYIFGSLTFDIIIKNLGTIIGIKNRKKLYIEDGLHIIVDEDDRLTQGIKRTFYSQDRKKTISFLKHLFDSIKETLNTLLNGFYSSTNTDEKEQIFTRYCKLIISLSNAVSNFSNITGAYTKKDTVSEFESVQKDYENLVILTFRKIMFPQNKLD